MYKIFILGPQGSGKGTQANILAEKLGIPALSMGQLFRNIMAGGSELGQELAAILNAGNLVPDELALAILKQRIEKPDAVNGYILDGYPRNIAQYEAYKSYDVPTHILVIEVPRAESMQRLLKRAELEGRADDSEEIIEKRLRIYEQETLPVIEKYRTETDVKMIDGVGTVEEIAERIERSLGI